MDKESHKQDNNLQDIVSKEKNKMADSKLLLKIEQFQTELKSDLNVLQSELRNLITGRNQQDELNKQLLSQLHQIGEVLQKLEQAYQYTHKLISLHDKGLEEHRQSIHELEKEIQKIKTVIRVD